MQWGAKYNSFQSESEVKQKHAAVPGYSKEPEGPKQPLSEH